MNFIIFFVNELLGQKNQTDLEKANSGIMASPSHIDVASPSHSKFGFPNQVTILNENDQVIFQEIKYEWKS